MSDKPIHEIDVWDAVIDPGGENMPPADAHAILRWSFNDEAKGRMEFLAERNSQGTISQPERSELEAYVNVGPLDARGRRALRLRATLQTGQ